MFNLFKFDIQDLVFRLFRVLIKDFDLLILILSFMSLIFLYVKYVFMLCINL